VIPRYRLLAFTDFLEELSTADEEDE